MDKKAKIYISGHTGLLGSALLRLLRAQGYENIITKSHKGLDLVDLKATLAFFKKERPQYVFHAAARVGSMAANMAHPAQFLRENIMMQTHVLHAAHVYGVEALISFGSNCAYPRLCAQPMREDALHTGPLEPTNEAYAIAKLAGIELSQSYNRQFNTRFLSVIPASFYGPRDHFGGERSHMIPQFIEMFSAAKSSDAASLDMSVDFKKVREFFYVDDAAEICIALMNLLINTPQRFGEIDWLMNIGTGQGVSLGELGEILKKIVGYRGRLIWAKSHTQGMPEKVLDVSRMKRFGLVSRTSLEIGLQKAYDYYQREIL